jgi:hypothetical protein
MFGSKNSGQTHLCPHHYLSKSRTIKESASTEEKKWLGAAQGRRKRSRAGLGLSKEMRKAGRHPDAPNKILTNPATPVPTALAFYPA